MVDAIVFHCQNPNYGKQLIAIDIYGIGIYN